MKLIDVIYALERHELIIDRYELIDSRAKDIRCGDVRIVIDGNDIRVRNDEIHYDNVGNNLNDLLCDYDEALERAERG